MLDPDFHFNFVDVRDVADGLIQAAERGSPGQRYILANRESSSLGEVIAAFDTLRPGQRLPARAPKVLLLSVAMLQMWRARLTGQPAELLPSQVRMFHGVRQRYCIDKAVDELGYRPRPPQEALRQAFEYLLTR